MAHSNFIGVFILGISSLMVLDFIHTTWNVKAYVKVEVSNLFDARHHEKGKNHKRIAILYTGHIRSYFHPMLRKNHDDNLIKPFEMAGYKVDIYYNFASGDCHRSVACLEANKSKEASQTLFLESLQEALSNSTGKNRRVFIVEDPEDMHYNAAQVRQSLRRHCGIDGVRQYIGVSVWSQWKRLSHAYEVAENITKDRGIEYDAMLKIRPDLYFVNKINASEISERESSSSDGLEEESNYILLPPHGEVGNGKYNDWAAACVGTAACPTLFNAFKEWEICGKKRSEGLMKKVCCVGLGGSEWLDMAWDMSASSITLLESGTLFPFTIARVLEMPKEVEYLEFSAFVKNITSVGSPLLSTLKIQLECGRLTANEAYFDACLQANSIFQNR